MALKLEPDDWALLDEMAPAWCQRHFAPYFGKPMLLIGVGEPMLEEFQSRTEVMVFCGLDLRKGHERKADPTMIISALHHFTPVCCFLGDDVMAALLKEAQERATRLPPGLPPLLIGGN